MNNNLIVKGICLKVPVSRAWKALSDPQEFGAWFGVKVEGTFRPGHINVGHITHPGYEHLEWKVTTEAVEPERYLAFKWHPYAVDPNTDYSEETPTLVEFRIEPMGDGTLFDCRRIRIRKYPGSSPSRSISNERRCLGGANEEH